MNPDQPVSTPPIQTPPQAPSTPAPPTVHQSQKIPLIIFGILEAIFPILALYILFPLISFRDSIEANSITPYIGAIFFMFTLLIALTQLTVGIFSLDLKLGPQKTKFLIILGAVLGALTIPAMTVFIIVPLYDLIKILQ